MRDNKQLLGRKLINNLLSLAANPTGRFWSQPYGKRDSTQVQDWQHKVKHFSDGV
jgi:hypothetical protein